MNDLPDREVTVFNAARRLSPGRRAAYLDEACAGDAALRQRIEELLKAGEDAGGFLESPPAGSPCPGGTVRFSVVPTENVGDRIGRYKLLQQIGEGGCGVVYMAEQEEPMRRRVALKVIKLGLDTKDVVARFEAERQALALMDHPNIAKVLDAGATAAGRPYFVMELVQGIKITDYCDRNQLSTDERLKLFVQVCEAIQHAHQKGVIHRDIKPSNVLVTSRDGVAIPKVIDFGIAKATTGQRLTDKTLFTAFEQFMGTPAYMSPEQASMNELGIDTRSDIYSLGILLYELLTGKTPFDANELLAAGLEAMRQIIQVKEPLRPSTRLSTMLQGELTTMASRRRTEIPKLIHLIKGDLDWIVMKSLEKDRSRRYETANGLKADVQRFLGHEPVLARPPSTFYQLQKIVLRNRLLFGSVTAITMAMVFGLGFSTWSLLREKAARQRAVAAEQAAILLREKAEAAEKSAQVEAAKSQQVAHFLESMLSSIDPAVALGRDTSLLKEVLDKTAVRVGQDLGNQPAVEAELRHTLGEVYWALGDLDHAGAMHRQALAIQRKLNGDDAQVADTLSDLAMVLWRQGKLSEADTMLREVLATQRKIPGDNLAVAKTLKNLAGVVNTRGKPAEAITLLREALAIQKEQLGAADPEVADTLSNLAAVLARKKLLAEAETNVCQALSIQTNHFGGDHPAVADSLNVLATIKEKQNDKDAAEKLYRSVLAMRQKVFGNEHPQVALAFFNLGRFLASEHRMTEAETALRSALAIQKKFLGSNAETIYTASELGVLLKKELKFSEAEPILQDSLTIVKELYGKDSLRAAIASYSLGDLLYRENKLPEAESAYLEAIRIRQKLNSARPDSADSLMGLWSIYQRQGRTAEAKNVLLEAINQNSGDAINRMGLAYLNGEGVTKNEAEALKWFKKGEAGGDPWCVVNLGRMYQMGLGVPKDLAQAVRYYQKAADHDCVGGLTYLARLYELGKGVPKDANKAKELLQRAVALGDSRGWSHLAWMLATSSNPAARDGTRAVALAEKLVASTNGKSSQYLDTLAASYAEAGQFDKAEATEQKALVLARAGTDTNLVNDLSGHLELFQKKFSYHETPPTEP